MIILKARQWSVASNTVTLVTCNNPFTVISLLSRLLTILTTQYNNINVEIKFIKE